MRCLFIYFLDFLDSEKARMSVEGRNELDRMYR